jgi:sugar (pentulose or hexulose) kinase
VTSLGAQTQLWNPRERDFSSLVEDQGWRERFPPLRNAWDVLGPLQLEVAERAALPVETPVLCGIHDSNANYTRYLAAGLDDFTLISTGTWLISFNPSLPLERLDPLRDTVSNSDLLGRPVACARFMGGREYAMIAGTDEPAAQPNESAVAALVARGMMALPSFTRTGGPFPGTGAKGRIVGAPPQSASERNALACLYVALMASVGLDLLDSRRNAVVHSTAGGAATRPAGAGVDRARRHRPRRSALGRLGGAHRAGAAVLAAGRAGDHPGARCLCRGLARGGRGDRARLTGGRDDVRHSGQFLATRYSSGMK